MRVIISASTKLSEKIFNETSKTLSKVLNKYKYDNRRFRCKAIET